MIRNRDLIKTTMLLTVSMIMASVAVGCGAGTDENEVNNDTEVVAEVQTEVKETVYDEVAVGMQYSGLITKDAVLYSTSDLNGKVADLKLDEIVTVTHHLYLDGKEMDIYKVKTESGITGYISEVDADFNSDIDYADTLVEIEGGDGEEVAESTEVESTEVAVEETIESAFDFTIVACDPVTKYTNRGSNIRSLPTKDSELLFSVNTNTSVTVTGTTEDGSWSRAEYGGLVCYIKSSLLSDTKVAVSSGSGSSSSSGSSQTSDSSGGTSSSSGSEDYDISKGELPPRDGGGTAGDSKTGGTTGSDCSDENWGGAN